MTFAVNIAQSGSNNQTMRNRIINGAMAIAQRSTSSLTVNSAVGDVYPVDRFNAFVSGSTGAFTVQQSSDVPTGSGFKNSIVLTVTTADSSLATNDICAIRQIVEGLNAYDLNWGTANAQPVTLSFWAKSSITGTHSGAFTNGDWTRAYAFTYTLSAANTWQYITVTAPGAPSGSWGNGNDRGIQVVFNMGTASANLSAANTWTTTSLVTVGATGSVQLISTLGATLFITGVQLEEGTAASPFEYRLYGTELALCQRYCPVWNFPSANANVANTFVYSTGTGGPFTLANPVSVRSPVTGITVSAVNQFSVADGDSSTALNGLTLATSSNLITFIQWSTATNRTNFRPHYVLVNTNGAFIIGNGCEL